MICLDPQNIEYCINVGFFPNKKLFVSYMDDLILLFKSTLFSVTCDMKSSIKSF